MRIPSRLSQAVAFSPSMVDGTLMTTLGCQAANLIPSFTIPSASSETVSALMGPSTKLAIFLTVSSKSAPSSLAISVGLVVTPLRIPQLATSSISRMFAVSRNIFTMPPKSHALILMPKPGAGRPWASHRENLPPGGVRSYRILLP